MDSIKIEDSEFITINGEFFDNKVKECMKELTSKQLRADARDPFIALLHSIAYVSLRSKLFKEN